MSEHLYMILVREHAGPWGNPPHIRVYRYATEKGARNRLRSPGGKVLSAEWSEVEWHAWEVGR